MAAGQILLVEDNQDDVMLTLRALRKNNFPNEVVVAHDGAEALDIVFAENPTDQPLPSLILLDLKLPKIDGLEVLRRIRNDERTQFVPIIILTSSKLEEDIASAYRGGANAFVRKPVSFSEFTDAVRALGMFWLMINETKPA